MQGDQPPVRCKASCARISRSVPLWVCDARRPTPLEVPISFIAPPPKEPRALHACARQHSQGRARPLRKVALKIIKCKPQFPYPGCQGLRFVCDKNEIGMTTTHSVTPDGHAPDAHAAPSHAQVFLVSRPASLWWCRWCWSRWCCCDRIWFMYLVFFSSCCKPATSTAMAADRWRSVKARRRCV